jgi:hypothetical protein
MPCLGTLFQFDNGYLEGYLTILWIYIYSFSLCNLQIVEVCGMFFVLQGCCFAFFPAATCEVGPYLGPHLPFMTSFVDLSENMVPENLRD